MNIRGWRCSKSNHCKPIQNISVGRDASNQGFKCIWFNNNDNSWFFFSLSMYFKVKECDKKFAANWLNVSHIGLAGIKPPRLERVTIKLRIISKEKRKKMSAFFFWALTVDSDSSNILIWLVWLVWCPLPPKKANYTVCLTVTQLCASITMVPEMGSLTWVR